MAEQPIDPGSIAVSRASKGDLVPVLNLFDEAVIWLNQRGIDKQWGSEPFSTSPQIHKQFMGWIEREALFVACLNDHIVGSLALSPIAPLSIASRWESFPASAFYLEAFATTRSLVGQNIGGALLQWAEQYTRESGRTTIWLDCWDENAALARYYQQKGFVPRGVLMVQQWRGQPFEKQIIPTETA